MDYEKELNFIVDKIKEAFNLFYTTDISVKQKSKHDLVTDIDKNIENYLSEAIKSNFENDKILGEESSFNEKVSGRTWTIDPIDGTCNMANGIELFGVQCSLIENDEVVVAAVFLPAFNYFFTATKNGGCYLNHQKVFVKQNLNINNAIISFGDYPHKNCTRLANWQNDAIKKIFNVVAKIRMFGSAAIDLSFVASGKTDATVIITKNLWDIAPGILICKEAGAVLVDLSGNPYNEYSGLISFRIDFL